MYAYVRMHVRIHVRVYVCMYVCMCRLTFQDPASVLLAELPHAHRPGRDGDRGDDGLGVARDVD
jgi:hypothetical protein